MSSGPAPFEQIVDAHGTMVLRVCRAVLGSHVDAEDAWSETFLAALRAWPELPATTNVEAWLVRIAHRKAIDVTRRRSRHAQPVEQVPDDVSDLGIPGAHDLDLFADLARLPDKQRTVIAYHYLAGLRYAEIAELVGGTPAAARRAAADGMKSLRRSLTAEAAGGVTEGARP